MPDTSLEEQLHKLTETQAIEKKKEADTEKKKAAAWVANPNRIAREIITDHQMIYYGDSLFSYCKGRYKILSDNQAKQLVYQKVKDSYRPGHYKEIYESLIAQCLVESINLISGVNLLNGVYDFTSGELLPHSANYLFTTQVQAVYDPKALCPRWRGFLVEMLDDDSAKIDILQEYAGYSLDINVNVEMILFLLGRGANGKSVFCDALKVVIGDGNYDTISLDDLKNKNYIAELLGKLINISTESQAKAEVYESALKKLASGEEIKVDRKFKHPFNFRSNCKHIYSLNTLPRVGDKTDAFFRRLITVPFNRQVDQSKRVLQLGRMIAKEESSGIINWMIEGYNRLRGNSWQFTKSEQCDAIANEYRHDNNNVLNFFDECCAFSESSFESNEHIYRNYTSWCKDNGVSPVKKTNCIKELVENFKLTRLKTSGIRGLDGMVIVSSVLPF